METQTIIMNASTKKEAMQLALSQYGENAVYVSPYRYASKGNNFYEFKLLGYYVIENQKWVRATRYNLNEMKQIKLYDDSLKLYGIGLY